MTTCPARTSGKRKVFSALALSAMVFSPHELPAQAVSTAEWNITADRIIRYEEPNSIVAEGNIILEKRVKLPPKVTSQRPSDTWADLLEDAPAKVEVSAGEIDQQAEAGVRYKTTVQIEADWLAYDVEQKSIRARGNIRLTSEDDILTAEKGEVSLETETGTFTDAVIIRKEDELHLEGKVIEKTGLNTYHIEDGWVVTCKVESGKTPPWNFASSDTTIKEGGYAFLKHATFNIKGVPVFYTPYMIVPVKDTRQSGFLLPEFASTTHGGFSFNIPYFWNLSNSMDITFFPEIYEERGFMAGAEFRYVLDEQDKGSFMANFLNDSLSSSDQSSEYYTDTGYTHTNSGRYWLRGKADHTYGENWHARLDLDIVSDRDYLTEFKGGYTGFDETDERFQSKFGRGFENRTDDTRQNSLKFLKTWNGMSLETDLLAINDVRVDSIKDNPDIATPLWKLPELLFSGILPIYSTPASFKWNTAYVNYWRDNGIGGHRFDLHPTVSSYIPISPYLETRAELGVRDTFYIVEEYGSGTWDESSTQNRLTADFEFEVGTTLLRTFALSGASADALDHQVRPFIRYNYIPDVNQDDLPKFDSVDQIDETNSITYGLDNYFDLFSGNSERELGWLKISQSYDFADPDDLDEPFSDILLRLAMRPVTGFFVEYETDYNVYGEGFVRHSLEGAYTNSRGDRFTLDYSYNVTDDNDIEQINASLQARLLARWSTKMDVEYSIAEDETNEANVSLLYTTPCWSIELQSKYTPEDTRYMVVFNLANIGNSVNIDLFTSEN